MFNPDLPNGNLHVHITLLRLLSEIGLLAFLSHKLAKLENLLHNCCLFGKFLYCFLESGWRSGRVCSQSYSIYNCIRRLCPTSHWGLAKDYWCEGCVLADTKETLLETEAALYADLCTCLTSIFTFRKCTQEQSLKPFNYIQTEGILILTRAWDRISNYIALRLSCSLALDLKNTTKRWQKKLSNMLEHASP